MVNKRGLLRIIEVMIASLIIISSVLIVVTNRDIGKRENLCSEIPNLLEELGKNRDIREQILTDDASGANSFLRERINNPAYLFEFKICEVDDICTSNQVTAQDSNVCAGERIISANAQQQSGFNPKKVKLFLFKYG
ncbi:MAG: hypothetical protein AABW80_01455 [Nanoarchaeota archaeon]